MTSANATQDCRKWLKAKALLFFVLAIVGTIGCRQAPPPYPLTIRGSGVVEARHIDLAFTTGGRLVRYDLEEGQEIAVGRVVAELDTQELTASLQQAEAAAAAAKAQTDALRYGARPEELAQARAAIFEAQTQVSGAHRAVVNAEITYHKVPELAARAEAASTQLSAAHATVAEAKEAMKLLGEGSRPDQIAAAEAAYREAQAAAGLADKDLSRMQVLFTQDAISRQQLDTARAAREVSVARASQAEATLRDLKAGARPAELEQARQRLERAIAEQQTAATTAKHAHEDHQDRLQARTALDAARSAEQTARAHLGSAQSALDRLLAGTRQEDILAAEKHQAGAQAQIKLLKAQIAARTLYAPIRARVITKSAEISEVVAAHAPIATVADLRQVWVRAYVSEREYGKLRIGQPVKVAVDSFPGRSFAGTITEIANQPEFTPRNIQTPDERSKLVFGVKVTLENPDGALKPGMPADCNFAAP